MALLTFVLLTSGVVALSNVPGVSACLDRARLEAAGGAMFGGWKPVDMADDRNRLTVAEYAEEVIVEVNKLSDEVTPYELTTDPKTGEYSVTEVYVQVTGSLNYCIWFEVWPAGCRNSIDHEDCDNNKKMCEAEVSQPPISFEQRLMILEIECQ